MKKSAVFLDRDGVINVDKNYVYRIKDFEWIEDAMEAIKYIKEKNFYVFVVSNQSGISRGFYNENDVNILHKYINNELAKLHTSIDEFYYSPYHPDVKNKKYDRYKNLRKPNTGMLENAFNSWSIDLSGSFLVGDKQTDVKCEENFGIKGYLYKSGSLLNFIRKIIGH